MGELRTGKKRELNRNYEFIVVGGGMAGVCGAIAAARHGVRTALVQNRPVLGGNASSEIRMHICGADYHMSRPNARETGILEEILLENKRRNPTMNYPVFDSVLWEKVHFQKNLDLYLNTQMTEVIVEETRIQGIICEQMTTETRYHLQAEYFMDATGDGTLGALAGADFALGREEQSRYEELLAPREADHVTMGNSLMFLARDMGKPVPFQKPFWANTYTEEQLKLRDHSSIQSGYWWVELGGDQLRIIEDGETIRDELLKAVYGIWDHIKNGGDHKAENFDLEWVGMLPGKRESRRLLGDYVLKEKDCASGRCFADAVAYGGWPMDIHTAAGFENSEDVPTVWNQVEDVYTIPYRCLYSRNIENLLLGGRAISCSHVAFSSTRVMGTCAVAGQAAGTAAAIAVRDHLSLREVGKNIQKLQQTLLRDDCYIPGIKNEDMGDLARAADVFASSWLAGFEPQRVVSGKTRNSQEQNECWKARIEEQPELQMRWENPQQVSMVQILFDSNLSREITPSIDAAVLARQQPGTPAELVQEYEVEFYLNGMLQDYLSGCGNGQRLQRLKLEKAVVCDQMVLRLLSTYGAEDGTVFEVRVYS